MNTHYYDLEDPAEASFNYRWMQPPQIAYFVSTMDSFGNPNLTPVTLGTLVCTQYPREGEAGEHYFTFSLGCRNLQDPGNVLEVRQGFRNLQKSGECVVSYIGYPLMRESAICNMPIPYGISEFDVAGLTPLASHKVKPFSVAECPVNMECRVVQSYNLGGYYQHYICKVVGLSVNADYVKADPQKRELGVYAIDPLFEVAIQTNETGNGRLYYGRLDPAKIHRTADDFGCLGDWVGNFEKWIDSECVRGKISHEESSTILALAQAWYRNPNPEENQEIKEKLTAQLKMLVQPRAN